MMLDTTTLLYDAGVGFFYVLLFIFALHALFVGYHWFTYGSSKRISLTAFAIYLLGGAFFLLTISLALQTL